MRFQGPLITRESLRKERKVREEVEGNGFFGDRTGKHALVVNQLSN